MQPKEDTNKIEFRNAFGIGAGNEKCQKIFYDINILDQKNHIFAEDNFLILELQRCTGFMQPKEDTNKIEFRNAFGIGAGNEKCQKIFYDINILDQKNHIFAEDNFLILELQFCS